MLNNFVENIIDAIQTRTEMDLTAESILLSFSVGVIPDDYEVDADSVIVFSGGDVWEFNTGAMEYDDKLECYIIETDGMKTIISF